METDEIASLYAKIIEGVGEDVTRDGLVKTPDRAARAIQYLCHGYEQSLDDIVNNAIFELSLIHI